MNKPNLEVKKHNEINKFDYIESIKIMKPVIAKFNKFSLFIVQELYKAQQAFRNKGYRTDLKGNKKRISFKAYCNEIGISKTTAYTWLRRYVPEEDKLLTIDEIKKEKIKKIGDNKKSIDYSNWINKNINKYPDENKIEILKKIIIFCEYKIKKIEYKDINEKK
jgi:hypothetical protein